MQKKQNKNFEGFTLTEAMIAVVILGFACSAVVLPFVSGASVRAEGARKTLSANLAADLTEQIVNTPFDQILDTFQDYQEEQGKMKMADGTFFTDPIYNNFSRKVTCTGWPQDYPDDRFILVNVRTFYNGNQIASVKRLISR
jgi:type II secretory pathway pseudopilin PulG